MVVEKECELCGGVYKKWVLVKTHHSGRVCEGCFEGIERFFCPDCGKENGELVWHGFPSSFVIEDGLGNHLEDVYDDESQFKWFNLVCPDCSIVVVEELDPGMKEELVERWKE